MPDDLRLCHEREPLATMGVCKSLAALLAVALGTLLLPPPVLAAQSERPTASVREASRGIEAEIGRIMREWAVPGIAIAIVAGDEIILSKGFGVRGPGTRAPMTKDTILPVASVSKQFAGVAAGLLVDDGKLEFDRPARMYVPAFETSDPLATLQITPRDLLSHRSGLPSHWFLWYNNRGLRRSELLRRLRHLSFTQPLRTTFQYSNPAIAIAGEVISQSAGLPYETVVEQRIFKPLGMDRTSFSYERSEADPNRMTGAIWIRGKYEAIRMEPSFELIDVGGGIYSTVDDLAKWTALQLSGGKLGQTQIISSSSLAETHKMAVPIHTSPDAEFRPTGYAMGWFTGDHRGERMLSHGGGTWGLTAEVTLLPERRIGVVILANQDSSRLPNALTRQILDRLMGHADGGWVTKALEKHKAMLAERSAHRPPAKSLTEARRLPVQTLRRYTGTYTHPGYGSVHVDLAGGRLRVSKGQEAASLVHQTHDVFTAVSGFTSLWAPEDEAAVLTFLSDGQGNIAGLRISSADGVTFERPKRN